MAPQHVSQNDTLFPALVRRENKVFLFNAHKMSGDEEGNEEKGGREGMRSGGSLFEGRERGSWNGNELQHWLNFSRFSHSADFYLRQQVYMLKF